jgi:uncharacterized protein (DUF1697 family)
VTRYAVLLRGINVGRAKRIGMGPLRQALTARGYAGVRTLLQSGNVVLDSDRQPGELAADVEAVIRSEFGFDVPVVVRTAPELAAVLAADPLAAVATDPARYLVTFLPAEPDPALVAALPDPGPADGAYRLAGRELYLWLPDGVLRTPVGAWRWDRLLGMTGTARNWNTVRTLTELATG